MIQEIQVKTLLTHRALEVIAEFGFPVHAVPKSGLVLRDRDQFEEISRKTYAVITFAITTADDALIKQLEPPAPVSSRRLVALRAIPEQHNGRVSLRSRLGQGTLFSVRLPAG